MVKAKPATTVVQAFVADAARASFDVGECGATHFGEVFRGPCTWHDVVEAFDDSDRVWLGGLMRHSTLNDDDNDDDDDRCHVTILLINDDVLVCTDAACSLTGSDAVGQPCLADCRCLSCSLESIFNDF